MASVTPWLQAIADRAPEYGDGWMRKVYRFDSQQAACDGHILVLLNGEIEGLKVFPKRIDQWFKGPLEASLDGLSLRRFCDPAIYAGDCTECRGTGERSCQWCLSYQDKSCCEDCDGTGIQECRHGSFSGNYGFIGQVCLNRLILWKLLANVTDTKIHFKLGTEKEAVRLDGDGWRCAIMPIKLDAYSKDQISRIAKFEPEAA